MTENKITQPLRDQIAKWEKTVQNRLPEGIAYDSGRLQCAVELSALLPAIDREIEAAQAAVQPTPTQRQIVFNWLMGEDIGKTDGYWGGAEEVGRVDQLLHALNLALIGSKQASLEAHDAELQRKGCKYICHDFPGHVELQDALEALKWHQDQLADLRAKQEPEK